MTARFTRQDVLLLVHNAEQAFAAWSRVRNNDEAKAFLALLLVTDRWKR
jgi:GAF domain-containing protein